VCTQIIPAALVDGGIVIRNTYYQRLHPDVLYTLCDCGDCLENIFVSEDYE
jgi:hypothetical protein